MLKKFFADRRYGFYVSLASVLLSIITAIIYVSIYGSTTYLSWWGFTLLLIGPVLAIVLTLLRLFDFAAIPVFVCSCFALWFYIYKIYFFVSSAVTGIQFSGFPASFFINAIFFVLTLVTSFCAVIMPQSKEVKVVDSKKEEVK